MSVPCRCSRCRRRQSKRRRLAHYVRAPRCAFCPGKLYEDRHRKKVERPRGKGVCWCDHYHFPHRRGSAHCVDGPLGRIGISFYERGARWVEDVIAQYRATGVAPAALA